jgi:hypothetical protein
LRRSPIGQVRVALDVEDGARSASGERRLLRIAVAYTDADGAFTIPCPRDGVFRLEASSRNRTSAVLEGVKSGAKLEITLAGRGDVFGVLLSASLDTSSLNVALLRTQGEPGGWSSSCSRDGRFDFSQIPPGRYSLLVRRVRSGEAPLELLHRTDLEVPADGVLDLGELSLD